MSQRNGASPALSPKERNIQRWQEQVSSQFPLIGGLIRAQAVQQLVKTVRNGSTNATRALVEIALHAQDAKVQAAAWEGLRQIRHLKDLEVIWAIWAERRESMLEALLLQRNHIASAPVSLSVLSALLLDRKPAIITGGSEVIPPLIDALHDPNPELVQRAIFCLGHLKNRSAIDAFCMAWVSGRSAQLADILIEAHYAPQQPVDVVVLTALKRGDLPSLEDGLPDSAPAIAQATADADPQVAANALALIANLKNTGTLESLCRTSIEKDLPRAVQALVERRFQPQGTALRALFFLVSGQWDQYDLIDFDRSLLRAAYLAASRDLRRRIARQIQQSGRLDYLTVLVGGDYRSRAGELEDDEAEILVQALLQQQEWERLWVLALDLPLRWSARIIRELSQKGWSPIASDQQAIFQTLCVIASQDLEFRPEEWLRILPPAVPRAKIRVSGRINDVSFAPTATTIAIATGNGQIVVWDYQRAEIVERMKGFHHAIGQVVYLKDGPLLAAERTNQSAACSLYAIHERERIPLGTYHGSLTAIEPAGDDMVISTCRDGLITLWDVPGRQKLVEKSYPFWAREVCVSPDQKSLALLHQTVNWVTIPGLDLITSAPTINGSSGTYTIYPSVVRHAAFLGSHGLALGHFNGQLGLLQRKEDGTYTGEIPLTRHPRSIRGLVWLEQRELMISIDTSGAICFTQMPNAQLYGHIQSPGDELSSLSVSSTNGAFMATGSSAAEMTLWDLRVLDIPRLASQPLCKASPDAIGAIDALLEGLSLAAPVRSALEYLRAALAFRFRYDIQVSDIQQVLAGEFDILLD